MVGYKVAIGLDKIKGPFLALVELETYDDSIIISPLRTITISPDGRPMSEAACRILGSLPSAMRFNNSTEIIKYRTNKAIIKSVIPFDASEVRDWNGKAYSVFDLSRLMGGEYACGLDDLSCFPMSYTCGKRIVSALDRDRVISCGEGIHFFDKKEDAILYTVFDVEEYVFYVFRRARIGWMSIERKYHSRLIRLSE